MAAECRSVGRSSSSIAGAVASAESIQTACRRSAAGGVSKTCGLRENARAKCGSLAVGKLERGNARRGKLPREILAHRVGFPKERCARQADLGRNRRNRDGGGPHEERCRNRERGERRQQSADEHLLNRLHECFPFRTE